MHARQPKCLNPRSNRINNISSTTCSFWNPLKFWSHLLVIMASGLLQSVACTKSDLARLWGSIWWQADIETVAEYSQSLSTNKQYYYNVIWLTMLVFGTIANFWPYLIWRAASSLYKATSRATETVFDGRRVSRLRGPGEKSKKEATSHPWESKPVTLHKSVFWPIFRPVKL